MTEKRKAWHDANGRCHAGCSQFYRGDEGTHCMISKHGGVVGFVCPPAAILAPAREEIAALTARMEALEGRVIGTPVVLTPTKTVTVDGVPMTVPADPPAPRSDAGEVPSGTHFVQVVGVPIYTDAALRGIGEEQRRIILCSVGPNHACDIPVGELVESHREVLRRLATTEARLAERMTCGTCGKPVERWMCTDCEQGLNDSNARMYERERDDARAALDRCRGMLLQTYLTLPRCWRPEFLKRFINPDGRNDVALRAAAESEAKGEKEGAR